MKELIFSEWVIWKDKEKKLKKVLDFPGIYVLAVAKEKQALLGEPFKWIEEIEYIGMTNSRKGLKGRLQQFENTMRGKTGHGGARRFRNDYRDVPSIDDTLFKKLYVSVVPFECEVTDNNPPEVLRIMGNVAKAEYECFAQFREKFPKLNRLPTYNKRESKKY